MFKLKIDIPSGWELCTLTDIAHVTFSGVDKKSESDEVQVRLCNYTDVFYNRYIHNNLNFMKATASIAEVEKCSLKKGDVVFTKDSETAEEIGICASVEEHLSNVICGYHLGIIRPINNKVYGSYLSIILNFHPVHYQFVRLANGVTRFGLNLPAMNMIMVPIPPQTKQIEIIDAIRNWDYAIEKTERLIEAKEKRFSWFIKSLIGAQCIHWEHLHAEKIFKGISEKNNGDEVLLSVTQDRGVIPRTMLDGRVMSPEGGTETYKLIKEGDFAISLRSFQGGIEYSRYQGLISPAYTVLRPKLKIHDEFYRHFFKSYLFIEKYLNIAVIGIRDGKQISIPDFMTVKIPYPPLKQQKQIAEILNTARQEIDLLKKQADAYRNQKRGLMQKLLTGQWRVKVE